MLSVGEDSLSKSEVDLRKHNTKKMMVFSKLVSPQTFVQDPLVMPTV